MEAILVTNPAPGTLHVACVAPGSPKVPKVSRKEASGNPKGATWDGRGSQRPMGGYSFPPRLGTFGCEAKKYIY